MGHKLANLRDGYLVEALVDPGAALPLQQGLHHLPVLVRPRHGRDGGVMVDLVKVEGGVEDGSHGCRCVGKR